MTVQQSFYIRALKPRISHVMAAVVDMEVGIMMIEAIMVVTKGIIFKMKFYQNILKELSLKPSNNNMF